MPKNRRLRFSLGQIFVIVFAAALAICLPEALGLRATEVLIASWLVAMPPLAIGGLLALLSPKPGMTFLVALMGAVIGCLLMPSVRSNLQKAVGAWFGLHPEWTPITISDHVGVTAVALVCGTLSYFTSRMRRDLPT